MGLLSTRDEICLLISISLHAATRPQLHSPSRPLPAAQSAHTQPVQLSDNTAWMMMINKSHLFLRVLLKMHSFVFGRKRQKSFVFVSFSAVNVKPVFDRSLVQDAWALGLGPPKLCELSTTVKAISESTLDCKVCHTSMALVKNLCLTSLAFGICVPV